MDSVIQVEQLGKRYLLGDRKGLFRSYDTLRDSLSVGIGRAGRGFLKRELDPTVVTPGRPSQLFWALRDISFDVQQGDVVGLIGHNGSGKSTLLRILTRLTTPNEGWARVRGSVGALLEVNTGLHPELTGRSNIYLKGVILGMSRAAIRARFDEIVDFSGVERFLDTPLKRFSTGMALRLGFAIAASLDPDILLVDEALAVGDMAFQQRCLAKMRDFAASGRTVLFVSHDLATVSMLCSTAILLHSGRLIAYDDTASVLARYQSSLMPATGAALTGRTDRSGSGMIRFTSLRASGTYGGDVRSGQSVSFTVGFAVAVDAEPTDVSFVVKLCDRYGSPLLTCGTVYQGVKVSIRPPSGNFVCTIPSLPLIAGRYQINLWCAVAGAWADDLRAAGYLDVLPGDYYGTGRGPHGPSEGPVLAAHSWTFTQAVPGSSAER